MTLGLSKKCLDRAESGVILRSEAGMATGTVMLIAVLMASMAIGILALNSLNSGRDTRYALFYSMIDVVNLNLYAFGQNDRAWRATLDYNYGLTSFTPRKFACIKAGDDCTAWTAPDVQWVEEIALRYPTNATTGTPFYDSPHLEVDYRDGFRLDGSVCQYSTASPAKIEDGCILHVKLEWRPFCISDCKIGPNKIIYELTYSTPKVDENNYAFGHKNFFLPAVPENKSGPLPIYNPYR